MAVLHRAILIPTKIDLVTGWLPGRPWYRGPEQPEVTPAGAFRFDDPSGEVGVETLLVTAGEVVYQVPLTYRGAPLPGADDRLVGTTEHSVLGKRWVYDATGDPVYASVLAAAVLAGAAQAVEYIEIDGHLEPREPSAVVTATVEPSGPAPVIDTVRTLDSAETTSIVTGPVTLTVVRGLELSAPPPSAAIPALTGTWSGQPDPVVLVLAHRTA